jgi:hypothetical protein
MLRLVRSERRRSVGYSLQLCEKRTLRAVNRRALVGIF